MHRPFLDSLAWTIALLLSGVAAGMFLMDFFGYLPVLPRLAPQHAVEFYQQSLPFRRTIFRIVTGSSGLAGVALFLFFSKGSSRRLVAAHLLCLVALVVYTNGVLVPLNQEIATWQAASPPPGWDVAFSKLVNFERLRSFLPAAAFTLQLIAFAVRMKGTDGLRLSTDARP